MQHVELLLAHGLAQRVGLAHCEACAHPRDLHDLLLVDDQAVGRRQNLAQRLLEFGVDRGDLLEPVFAQGVVRVRVHSHGAGAVQRRDGGDVLELRGPHLFEQRPHARAVKLEYAEGVRPLEKLEGGLVVQLDLLDRHPFLAVVDDVVESVLDRRQIRQPEEVHLQHAQFLAQRIFELGDRGAVGRAFHDRDDVHERLGAHEHGTGVHAPLAREAGQALGQIEDLGGVLVARHKLAEITRLDEPLGLFVVDVG